MENTTDFSSETTESTEDYDSLMCDRSGALWFRSRLEPPLFWATAVLGLGGNMLVLWIYLFRRRGLKTITHLYLLHLSLADLLFLLSLPLWALEARSGWVYGPVLCKLNATIYKVNLFAVALFLACVAVDRYVVIVHSKTALNSQKQRRTWARAISISVWLLALLLATPELAFATTTTTLDEHMICRTVFPVRWGRIAKAMALSIQVSVGFCVPLVVMAICYAVIGWRLLKTHSFQKHRPLLVVMAIVVAFVVTQLPYNIVLITEIWDAHSAALTDCDRRKNLDKTGQILKSLAYSHAAMNPFLYALIGQRFRQEVMSLIQRTTQQKKNHILSSKTRTRTLSDSDTSQALSL